MKLFFASLLLFTASVAFGQSTQFGDFKVLGGNIVGTQNIIDGYATTATAAGTTTLTKTSAGQQYFTGSSTQTVLLPVVSTLVLGQSFTIVNNSTGAVTVQSSGANTLQAMQSGTQLTATVISLSGTTAASWSFIYTPQALSAMTTLGDMLYEDATPKPVRLAGNTTSTKKYLSQTGTGSVSAAPSWLQPACGDLSNAAASCSTDATNASNISSGTLPSGRLPNPTASTLGGIESYAAVTHQWINAISTLGVPSSTQPACADLSNGAASCSTDTTNATNISSGILAIGVGGSGQTTANAALNAFLPSQSTNSGKFLQTNGTNTSWASSTAGSAFNVVSKTTTYSAAANDYILASSASFTITLPTAVGISGQSIAIQHAGVSLSAVYTLATTLAQTVGGIASGSYALYTNGETLVVVSDGANWQIQSHKTTTAWTAYTPTFSVGLGSPTAISYYWSRNGSSMRVRGTHINGTTAASLFSMSIPSGASIDTTAISINNTISNPGSLIGQWVDSGSTVSYTNMVTATGTSATLVYFGGFSNGAAKLTPANANNSGSGVTASIIFEIPISGWQP